LIKGIARVTCRSPRAGDQRRITIALIPPGPIPAFPAPPFGRFDFRSEAYNDCRVGSLSWKDFDGITAHNVESAFRRFHQSDLQQWYRLLLRSSSFLSLDLHERVAITLRELASDFGIKESRGALLRVLFSHKDIADLVSASRPRVTEQLAQLEREHLIIRQGRQLIICADKIEVAGDAAALSTDAGAFIRAQLFTPAVMKQPLVARPGMRRAALDAA
jgi:DNA-binding MarR family transcriptional regulator